MKKKGKILALVASLFVLSLSTTVFADDELKVGLIDQETILKAPNYDNPSAIIEDPTNFKTIDQKYFDFDDNFEDYSNVSTISVDFSNEVQTYKNGGYTTEQLNNLLKNAGYREVGYFLSNISDTEKQDVYTKCPFLTELWSNVTYADICINAYNNITSFNSKQYQNNNKIKSINHLRRLLYSYTGETFEIVNYDMTKDDVESLKFPVYNNFQQEYTQAIVVVNAEVINNTSDAIAYVNVSEMYNDNGTINYNSKLADFSINGSAYKNLDATLYIKNSDVGYMKPIDIRISDNYIDYKNQEFLHIYKDYQVLSKGYARAPSKSKYWCGTLTPYNTYGEVYIGNDKNKIILSNDENDNPVYSIGENKPRQKSYVRYRYSEDRNAVDEDGNGYTPWELKRMLYKDFVLSIYQSTNLSYWYSSSYLGGGYSLNGNDSPETAAYHSFVNEFYGFYVNGTSKNRTSWPFADYGGKAYTIFDEEVARNPLLYRKCFEPRYEFVLEDETLVKKFEPFLKGLMFTYNEETYNPETYRGMYAGNSYINYSSILNPPNTVKKRTDTAMSTPTGLNTNISKMTGLVSFGRNYANTIKYDTTFHYDDEYSTKSEYVIDDRSIVYNTNENNTTINITGIYYNNYNYYIYYSDKMHIFEEKSPITGLKKQTTTTFKFNDGLDDFEVPDITRITNQYSHWEEDTDNSIKVGSNTTILNLTETMNDKLYFHRVLDDFVVTDLKINFPAVDRPGYDLKWRDTKTNEIYEPFEQHIFTNEEDREFDAVWTPLHYTVNVYSINPNGSYTSEPVSSNSCTYGELTNITAPEVDGYTFYGWKPQAFNSFARLYVGERGKDSLELGNWQKVPDTIDDINNIFIYNSAKNVYNTVLVHYKPQFDNSGHMTHAKLYTKDKPDDFYNIYYSNEDGWYVKYNYVKYCVNVSTATLSWTTRDSENFVPRKEGQVYDLYPLYRKNNPDKINVTYLNESGDTLLVDTNNYGIQYTIKNGTTVKNNAINQEATENLLRTGYVLNWESIDGTIYTAGTKVTPEVDLTLRAVYTPMKLNLQFYDSGDSLHEDEDEIVATKTIYYDEHMTVAELLDGIDIPYKYQLSGAKFAHIEGLSTDLGDVDFVLNGESPEDLSDCAFYGLNTDFYNPKVLGTYSDNMNIPIYPVWVISAKYTVHIYTENEEYGNIYNKYRLQEDLDYEEECGAYNKVEVIPKQLEGYVTPDTQIITAVVPKVVNNELVSSSSVSFYYDIDEEFKQEEYEFIDDPQYKAQHALRLKEAGIYNDEVIKTITLDKLAERAQDILDGEEDEYFEADLTALKDYYDEGELKSILSDILYEISNNQTEGYKKLIGLSNSIITSQTDFTIQTLVDKNKENMTDIEKYEWIYLAKWFAPALEKNKYYEEYNIAVNTVYDRGTTVYTEIVTVLNKILAQLDGLNDPCYVVVNHILFSETDQEMIYKTDYYVKENGSQFKPSDAIDEIADFLLMATGSEYEVLLDEIPNYTVEKDMTINLIYGTKVVTEPEEPEETKYEVIVKYTVRTSENGSANDPVIGTVSQNAIEGSTFTPSDLDGYENKIKALFPNKNIKITKPTSQTYTITSNRVIEYPYLVEEIPDTYTATVTYYASYKDKNYPLGTIETTVTKGSSWSAPRMNNDIAVIKQQFGEDIDIGYPNVPTITVDGNININYIYSVTDKNSGGGESVSENSGGGGGGGNTDPDDPEEPEIDPNAPQVADDETYVKILYKSSYNGSLDELGTSYFVVKKGVETNIPNLENLETILKQKYGNKILIGYPTVKTVTTEVQMDMTYVYVVTDDTSQGEQETYTLTIKHYANIVGVDEPKLIATTTVTKASGSTVAPILTEAQIKESLGNDIAITEYPVEKSYNVTSNKTISYMYYVKRTNNNPTEPEYTLTVNYVIKKAGKDDVSAGNYTYTGKSGDVINVPKPNGIEQTIQNLYGDCLVAYPDVSVTLQDKNVTITYEITVTDKPADQHTITVNHYAVYSDNTKELMGTNTITTDEAGTAPIMTLEQIQNVFTGQNIAVTFPTPQTYTATEDVTINYNYPVNRIVDNDKISINYVVSYEDQLYNIGTAVVDKSYANDLPDIQDKNDKIKSIVKSDLFSIMSRTFTVDDNVASVVYTVVKNLHIVEHRAVINGNDTVLKTVSTDSMQAPVLTKAEIEEILDEELENVSIPEQKSFTTTNSETIVYNYNITFKEGTVSENSVCKVTIKYYGKLNDEKKLLDTKEIVVVKNKATDIPQYDNYLEVAEMVFNKELVVKRIPMKNILTSMDTTQEMVYEFDVKPSEETTSVSIIVHHVILENNNDQREIKTETIKATKTNPVTVKEVNYLTTDVIKEFYAKINKNTAVIKLPDKILMTFDKNKDVYVYYEVTLEDINQSGQSGTGNTNETNNGKNDQNTSNNNENQENSNTETKVDFKVTETADGRVVITEVKYTGKGIIEIPSVIQTDDGKTIKVTDIADNAFKGTDATKIVIQDGITTIGKNTFANMENLTEIVLPSTLTTIGEGAFANSTALEKVTIPEKVKEIPKNAFKKNTSLKNISLGKVTNINEGAFEDCKALDVITLPKTVTNIAKGAFKNASITKIIGSNVKTIGNGAFKGCANLKTVSLPKAQKIGDSAFEGCKALTKVVIGKNTTTIGKKSFYKCSKLKTITIKSKKIKKVGKNAFKNINKKAVIKVPKNKLKAYKKLFKGKIPKTVKIK